MKFEKALERLNKCNGDCRACKHFRIKTAETECGGCYAYYCDIVNRTGRNIYVTSLSSLRSSAMQDMNDEIAWSDKYSN